MSRISMIALGFAAWVATAALPAAGGEKATEGKATRVPFRLTDTNHILIRARINNRGPFHFIVDTGAPALFVSKAAAKKAGIPVDQTGWGRIDRLEIEGGLVVPKARARVEDPFQITGMNALNLPGVRLDGLIGYTILARYRIELNLTRSHMIWTPIGWKPPQPRRLTGNGKPLPEIAAMSGLVKLATAFIRKRPDPVYLQRPFVGIEVEDTADGVRVKNVIAGSPAAKAGLRPGDQLVRYQDSRVKSVAELNQAARQQVGTKEIRIVISRDGQSQSLTIPVEEGL